MRQLFRELKRRKVYRVAAVCAGVAFVRLQATRLIFPTTTLQGLYDKLVVVAFVAFPVALVIGWAFELTSGASIGPRRRKSAASRSIPKAEDGARVVPNPHPHRL